MKNYICINDQKVELTQEQAEQIRASFGLPEAQLKDLAPGDTFKIGTHEFIVLEQTVDTTAIIRKELLPNQAFGSSNNFGSSAAGETCYRFAAELAAIIGAENIVEHTVDLTSDDGLKDYGTIRCSCSLLTADLYRRYVEILDNFNPGCWWWLATAYSTPKHGNEAWVKCVSPSGHLHIVYYGNDLGVRPFCILKSTIFVSK